MATYYIDPVNGSNSNNGLGPDASHATNKPFATIGKILATSGVGVAGDIAYLAPGSYREAVTVNITAPGSAIQIIGDPANAQGFKTSGGALVAAGQVVWTAYTTDDVTAPTAAAPITLNGRPFLTFEKILFVGGNTSNGSCVNASTAGSNDVTFTECVFLPAGTGNNAGIRVSGTTTSADNWLIQRCVILQTLQASAITNVTSSTNSGVADVDRNFIIDNCLILGFGSAPGVTFSPTTGTNTFKQGGFVIKNSTIMAGGVCVSASNAGISTSLPIQIRNCVLGGQPSASVTVSANTSGQIVEDYCLFLSNNARSNVTAGTNSISNWSRAPLLEVGQAELWGFLTRSFLMPMAGSPILGFGNDGSYAASVDFLNRPRPAGGASTSKAIGYLERHDTATQETTTVDASGSGIKIVGPGDHHLKVPVDATATTISIKGRYDTNHGTTNKPQVLLLANAKLGVAAQTLTMSAAANTWESLTTSSFTPTAKGVVTIRLVSRSAAGNGVAYFDTLS